MSRPRLDAVPSGQPAGSCLVAVDGSEASVPALVWSLRYASDHDLRVEVLTVWPPHRSVLVHEVPGHFCAPRWRARTAQADVVGQALERVPDPPSITTTLENADAVDAIVRATARHDLVVLGSDSRDPRHRLTDRVIDDASCDVVVVDAAGEPIGGRSGHHLPRGADA